MTTESITIYHSKLKALGARQSQLNRVGRRFQNMEKTKMNGIHIYTRPLQPATDWEDLNSEHPMRFTCSPESLMRAHCCDKLRRAKNCVVQAYYDHLAQWCADGKGCKSEAFKLAKEREAFRNRSRAQKARYAKLKGASDGP